MPDKMQVAFLEILRWTLLKIRNETNLDVCRLLADHAHNIPEMIGNYTFDKFYYYWHTEKPSFLENLHKIDPSREFFHEQWLILEDFLIDTKAEWP